MDVKLSSIEEVRKMANDSSTSVAIKVLSSESVTRYTNKDGQQRQYFRALVADQTGSCWIRMYAVKYQTLFVPNTSLLVQNLVKKTGNEILWGVASTTVCNWAPLTIPNEVLESSKESNQDLIVPLEKAIVSPSTSTVVAKILQTSPVKYRRNGELALKFLRIQDQTMGPRVKMALFGEDAMKTYTTGEVISVTDVYPWKNSKDTLSTKKSTKVEFLPATTIVLEEEDAPLPEDDDFKDDNSEPAELQIMGIAAVYKYPCCPNAGCRNKKLDSGTCPRCNTVPSTDTFYLSASLVVNHDNKLTNCKAFLSDISAIFNIPMDQTAEQIKAHLCSQLPLSAKGFIQNGVLNITSHKRKSSE